MSPSGLSTLASTAQSMTLPNWLNARVGVQNSEKGITEVYPPKWRSFKDKVLTLAAGGGHSKQGKEGPQVSG